LVMSTPASWRSWRQLFVIRPGIRPYCCDREVNFRKGFADSSDELACRLDADAGDVFDLTRSQHRHVPLGAQKVRHVHDTIPRLDGLLHPVFQVIVIEKAETFQMPEYVLKLLGERTAPKQAFNSSMAECAGVWRINGERLDERIEGQRDLVALNGKPVIPPSEVKFYPAAESLQWREQHLATAV
jgi:hypothetical protein